MNHICKALCILLLLSVTQSVVAQQWSQIRTSDLTKRQLQRVIVPDAHTTYRLDLGSMEAQLAKIASGPTHHSQTTTKITLPIADGTMAAYLVHRADVLHPNLGRRYPSIQAYTGYNVDRPSEIVKLSMSPRGLDAMILGHEDGTVFIDAYAKGDTEHYIAYYKEDYSMTDRHNFSCEVEHPDDNYKPHSGSDSRYGDCTLRTYRLAMACTGEYAAFHGGTVESVLTEYNTAMNRVNGLYERDAAITMQLIENTDTLIFFNASTDPYTNESGSNMLGQNQNTIDQRIGINNYDIGHVFSTGGGGIASLRSPCTNRRARGVTGLANPINDPFYVDYVAHEIGHQFGGNHTQNNSCQRNGSTAMEPGSGATIMGYAGICAPNLQLNSDDYFHTVNLEEIADFVVAGNGGCAVETPLTNTPPSFDVGIDDFTIPTGTAFILEAHATDPDTADVITYTFEQMDNEVGAMPPTSQNSQGPIFRSLSPSVDSFRYFPTFNSVLNGTNGNTWEVLPAVGRTIEFTITARDNAVGGGCTDIEEVTITVDGDSGPFTVEDPFSLEWGAGSQQNVRWEVANTDLPPVDCPEVDIYLDLGDQSFTTILAEGVPNDGQHSITVPAALTDDARLMIVCSSASFYAVNPTAISIVPPYFVSLGSDEIVTCPGDDSTVEITIAMEDAAVGPVTLSAAGLPPGVDASFAPEQLTESGTSTLTLTGATADAIGNYELLLTAMTAAYSITSTVPYTIALEDNVAISDVSPSDGSRGQSIFTTLTWNSVAGNDGYLLQVATDPAFKNMIVNDVIRDTSYELKQLTERTVYYWQVVPATPCVAAAFAQYFSFQVGNLTCQQINGETYTETLIEDIGYLTSTVIVPADQTVDLVSVNIDLQHTFVGSLAANLVNPAGTRISLFNRLGIPASNFGCTRPNLRVRMSDSAPLTNEEMEMTCESGTDYAVDGEFMPRQSLLGAIDGNSAGGWTLEIIDTFTVPNTVLNSWSLEACIATPVDEAIIIRNDGIHLVEESDQLFSTMELEVQSDDDANTTFTMAAAPGHGQVQLWDSNSQAYTVVEIGDSWSQQQLNDVELRYIYQGSGETTDAFTLDIIDDQGRWYDGLVVPVSIDISNLAATVSITEPILCGGSGEGATIQLAGIAGVAPYTYSLDDNFYQMSAQFSSIDSGEYTGYVKDAVGTVATVQFTIVEPTILTAIVTADKTTVTVTASGGTGALSYSSDGVNYQVSNIFDLPNQATHIIRVRDENMCEFATEININFIEAAVTITEPISCFGAKDGRITIADVVGGVLPYSYQLVGEAAQSTAIFDGLAPADYDIIVADAEGYVFSLTATVTEPDELTVVADTSASSVTIIATGGTEPYSYNLAGDISQDEPVYTDLANGSYAGAVTDSRGCVAEFAFEISNSTVSTADIDGVQVTVYPNPVNNVLHIHTTADIIQTELHRMDGQLVSSTSYSSTIDMSALPAGIYTLTLLTHDTASSLLVVKGSD